MKCPFCNGENIEEGIRWRTQSEISLGLGAKKGILLFTIPVYADLCRDCGTIVRNYIKDDTNQKWMK